MKDFNEVEAIFLKDVHSKKKEFAEFKSATKGRRLGKKSYMLPSDFMSRKEKLKHWKAGEIVTTNLFDNILTIAEFNELETHEKKNRLQYWRTKYSNKEIQQKMGIANSPFYKIIAELELPKAPRVNSDKRKGTTTTKKKETKSVVPEVPKSEVPEVKEEPKQPLQEVIVNGLNVIFNGTYDAQKIEKQLTKIMLLLDGEEDDFYIELKLMQKQPIKK